jgi:hypothetical protein
MHGRHDEALTGECFGKHCLVECVLKVPLTHQHGRVRPRHRRRVPSRQHLCLDEGSRGIETRWRRRALEQRKRQLRCREIADVEMRLAAMDLDAEALPLTGYSERFSNLVCPDCRLTRMASPSAYRMRYANSRGATGKESCRTSTANVRRLRTLHNQ